MRTVRLARDSSPAPSRTHFHSTNSLPFYATWNSTATLGPSVLRSLHLSCLHNRLGALPPLPGRPHVHHVVPSRIPGTYARSEDVHSKTWGKQATLGATLISQSPKLCQCSCLVPPPSLWGQRPSTPLQDWWVSPLFMPKWVSHRLLPSCRPKGYRWF